MEAENRTESPWLRNLSFGVLFLAGLFGQWTNSRISAPEEAVQRLEKSQADLSFRFTVPQAVFLTETPESEAEDASSMARDQILDLCKSRLATTDRNRIQCAVLLAYLKEDHSAYASGVSVYHDEFRQLYEDSRPLEPNASLFDTPVADLVRLKQSEVQGDQQQYDRVLAELKSDSVRIQLIGAAVLLLVILATILGFIFTVITILKKPDQKYGPEVRSLEKGHLRSFLEGTILVFFGISALIPALGGFVPGSMRMPFLVAAYALLFSGVLFYVQRQSSSSTLMKVFGRTGPVGPQLGLGILGWCAIVPAAVVTVLPMLTTLDESTSGSAHPIAFVIQDHFLEAFILAVIIAPILEEVVFRGFLYGYLRSRLTVFSAAPITGIIFAVLHPQGLVAVPYLFILGTGLCLLREYNRSILPAIVAHMITNGLVMMAASAMLTT